LAKKKNKSNYYFTQEHEDAIIAYNATDSKEERTRLYVEFIQPAFDELVDKIVYTFKFNNLPNINTYRDECKIWLTTILEKYNPDRGFKAFAYFSVITKNWFIAKVKKNKKRAQKEVYFEDVSLANDQAVLTNDHDYESEREEREFWSSFFSEMDSWDENVMRPNELRVYKAVQVLFKNIDNIEIFNKKAIYMHLRDITELNTKQVVNGLNRLRSRYKEWRLDWNGGNV